MCQVLVVVAAADVVVVVDAGLHVDEADSEDMEHHRMEDIRYVSMPA